MEVTRKLIEELQNRLKVGNRRGVHLNAIPSNSRYKFDLNRLSYINKDIPNDFVEKLLSENPLKFKITWKDNVPDLNELFEDDQVKLVKITKSFENLINQTEAIESEKGINTFGFGFPILARRDQKDNKLTVSPVLIWSLRIKRTREFNTWEIVRDEDDPVYLNEVLINHLESDSQITIDPISPEFLDDGLIDKEELIQICYKLLTSINSKNSPDLKNILREKLEDIKEIPTKKHFENLPITSNNSFIDFSGLFSIFEVQKQNIIQDYDKLLDLDGYKIDLEEMENHHFQPISSIETDPSQQGILHALETSRNILIQGPPGTGKSQSLTAILVNALENHKKTIVVCEKRTALEVLYNSLQEKGLGRHSVLIKDIVKDRRLAIDSVRDRVDYSGSRRNSTWNTNLAYSIEKSKKLIDSINNKHIKVGKKLAGDRNWTQTVGVLLSNLKKVKEHYNLNLDKKLFEYSSDELNGLLETLREGQSLYVDYAKYVNLSFLNTSKFTGENPFLVERTIKDTFDEYQEILSGIEILIKTYKEEYLDLRAKEVEGEFDEIKNHKSHVESEYANLIDFLKKSEKKYIEVRSEEINIQIENVKVPLGKLIDLYQSFSKFILERKSEYTNIRQNEIEAQWDKINKIQFEIEKLFDENSQNTLFYQDDKKLSFTTKIKSIFSSATKSILRDSKQIELDLKKLIEISNTCPDFPTLKNTATTREKEDLFRSFKKQCEKLYENKYEQISSEFDNFNFEEFFSQSIDEIDVLEQLERQSSTSNISSEVKKYFYDTESDFGEFLYLNKEYTDTLNSKILSSRDLNSIEMSGTIDSQKEDFKNYSEYLGRKSEELNEIAIHEFNGFFPDLEKDLIEIKLSKSNLTSAFGKSSHKIFKDCILEMQSGIVSFEKDVNEAYQKVFQVIKGSNDLKEFDKYESTDARFGQIIRVEDLLDKDLRDFKLNVHKELEKSNFLSSVPEKYSNKTLSDGLDKIISLSDKIIKDNWVDFPRHRSNSNELIERFESILKKYKSYIDHEEDVFSVEFKWYKFFNDQNSYSKKVIEEVNDKKDWRKVFLAFYLDSLLTENADMHLPTDEKDYHELDKALSEFGKKQVDYIHHYWDTQQKKARMRFERENPNLSIENLYNKRKSHNHQKLSLRQVIKYDLDLFTDFFPIILTTPDVCSNMFQEKHKYFDIVLFDEASQLKLEDNLPALLKGKQIVIAGDEHQMPPSNYFSKIFDGSIDDEDEVEDEEKVVIDRDNILLSCESLLDFATELKFDKRFLDFHYRSRHPYLIDFSNHAFYNQRLIPLPNSFDYTPIKHIQVNGSYSGHTNEREADAVLSIIENNIHRLPSGKYPSIGIATFNIAQRNLIKSRILDRRKFEKYKEFNDKIQELEEAGLFVKNLENIQGDERDVIILSTTYGINQEGKFSQRFGPINHQKGYKLLNVIITRAKYKIYVCTSIPEKVYLNYKELLITEGANNRRSVFFAYLAYTKAISDKNHEARKAILADLAENSNIEKSTYSYNPALESPFEEEVYEELTLHFDESKIIPQLQFAGFRIDLVYDPQHDGLPKIAIECDGATYHSSREAYLYDRHRQKILENHGFVFHRIWSTNWWRNPKREAQHLIDFIKSIESKDPELFSDDRQVSQAFTDNIEVILNELPFNDPEVQIELEENIQQIIGHSLDPIPEIPERDKIKSYSKVKVNYLNNNQEILVELIENGGIQPINDNGIMKINIKTPLGQALLGKSIGETVKIGKLDNYVEILEIFN